MNERAEGAGDVDGPAATLCLLLCQRNDLLSVLGGEVYGGPMTIAARERGESGEGLFHARFLLRRTTARQAPGARSLGSAGRGACQASESPVVVWMMAAEALMGLILTCVSAIA